VGHSSRRLLSLSRPAGAGEEAEQAWCYSLGRGIHPIGVQPSGNLLLPPPDSPDPATVGAATGGAPSEECAVPQGQEGQALRRRLQRGIGRSLPLRLKWGQGGGGSGRRRNCRDAGLGALGRLPDALLLEGVMASLGPRELGSLCVVSHAAHAFAMHEDLWRALTLGELQGEFEFQGTWRDTYLAATGRTAGGCCREWGA